MNFNRAILTSLIIISAVFLGAEIEEYYFSFEITENINLPELQKLISIDNIEAEQVFAYATGERFEMFRKTGINYTLLPHPGTLIVPEMTASMTRLNDWDTYPTYELYLEMMYQFETDHPDLCRIIKIGESVNGRDLLFAKISANVDENEAEPEFMYTATMHGDETAGYILMLRLIDYLLTNYGTDDRITNMVDNIEVWINPLANPDGTYWSGNHTVYGARRSNANGVDLNRNFPDPEDGQNPDGYEWQPETIAMMDISAAKNFIHSANFHGGAEVVNYPWDTWITRHADDAWYQTISHTYADNCQENSPAGYMDGFNDGITNGFDWYTTSGCRQDFMNYFRNCREVTLEISNVKLLPADELPDHWIYNRESFLFYIEEVLYGFRGNVTNPDGNPVYAQIAVLDHDMDHSEVMSDKILGNYHRMIEPGNWSIEATAYAYNSTIVENIETEYNEISWVDISMEPAPEAINLTGLVLDADSGEIIPDAMIEVLNAPVAPVFSSQTGSYSLYLLAGEFEFLVSAPGYLETQFSFPVNEENNFYDFQLSVGPMIGLSTNFIAAELPVDTTATETLIITNNGGGILEYNIWTETADRSMLDCYVTCSAQTFNLGESTEWIFTLFNNSPDGEWIKGLYLQFPANVTVEGATDFIGGSGGDMLYDSTTGSGVEVHWDGETALGFGVLHDGEIAQASVEVTISQEFADEITLAYLIEGDGYGAEPHEFSDTITLLYPLRWIELDSNSGSLASGESDEINISFDTHDLEPELYTCNIVVSQEENGYVNIPVELTVNPTFAEENQLPQAPVLFDNYPNPFNPSTTISYQLTGDSYVSLSIYNIRGQLVKTLVNDTGTPGNYSVVWSGKDDNDQSVNSGIYFSRLVVGDQTSVKKMLLLK